MLASLVLKLEVTHARSHLKSQLVCTELCDLENVSQSAPKDIFEVVTGVIVKENQLVCTKLSPMCDLESESQNGCIMYTFSLTIALDDRVANRIGS